MYKSEIHASLDFLTPIGLNEMDGVTLMNRVETKYLFSVRRLPELLNCLNGSYKVLDIESVRAFPYHTTYLDTAEFLFFNQQVTGKLNRHKIRFRTYESTGVSFLEIKKKTNKNRTIKWRIENNSDLDCHDEVSSTFIQKYLPDPQIYLQPVLVNRFTRITLVGTETIERITLDYNLAFSNMEGRDEELPFLAVAELKTDGYFCNSPFALAMKQLGIHPNGFSKYSMGNIFVRDMPHKNVLKQKLLLIKKIENEYYKSDLN